MNFVPDDLSQISDEGLATALEENLNRWTKTYLAFVTTPLNDQNPELIQINKVTGENINFSSNKFVDYEFRFDENTFYLDGSGKTFGLGLLSDNTRTSICVSRKRRIR